MKKLFLGLASVFMLISVSCKSNNPNYPVSLKYVDGEVRVGEIPAEWKTFLVSSGKVNGVYAKSTCATLSDDKTVLKFSKLPEGKQTVVLVGSQEELDLTDQANWQKLQPISNEVKDILETEMTLSTSSGGADNLINIVFDNDDKKTIILSTNANDVNDVNVRDYVILVGGEKVTFTRDSNNKRKWKGTASAEITRFTTKAAIYKAKGANYLKNEIILD